MASKVAAQIGAKIREARNAKGLSQNGLAVLLPGKASGDQVSKWERGENRPSDDTLLAIAKALDRDFGWFFREDKPPTPDLMGAAHNGGAGQGLEELSRELGQLRGVVDEIMRLARDQSDAIQDLRRLADAFQAAQDARETREPPEEDSGT